MMKIIRRLGIICRCAWSNIVTVGWEGGGSTGRWFNLRVLHVKTWYTQLLNCSRDLYKTLLEGWILYEDVHEGIKSLSRNFKGRYLILRVLKPRTRYSSKTSQGILMILYRNTVQGISYGFYWLDQLKSSCMNTMISIITYCIKIVHLLLWTNDRF